LFAGCDQDAPPLEELPLRDSLRADSAVALAPAEKKSLDGGIDSGAESARPSTAGGSSESTLPGSSLPIGAPSFALSSDNSPTAILKGTPTPYYSADAGVTPPLTETPQPSKPAQPTAVDVCSACTEGCASSGGEDSGGDDSCDTSSDSGDDACDSSGDTTGDSCNGNDAGSGSIDGGGQCQVGRARQGKKSQTAAWVLAPLGYLLFRRRA
jgi:hypothetical protein